MLGMCSVAANSATPCVVACKVPLSMEFSRQEQENSMDSGAWRTTVHGLAELDNSPSNFAKGLIFPISQKAAKGREREKSFPEVTGHTLLN